MSANINFRSALLGTLLLLFAVLAPASAQASTLTPFAYVADGGEGAVQVINTATNARVASVPVPSSPWLERDVVSSPDGSMVYVSSEDGGVTAIDTATNTVAWQMPSHFEENWSGETDNLPGAVIGMAVSPDGQYLYASLGLDDAFGVIDTATHKLLAVTYVGGCPAGIAVSPDGSRAYLANTCNESVQVINTAMREIVETIATNNQPWAVAVNPKGGHAYVSGGKNGLVIDTTTNTVSGGFTDVAYPAGLAVTPDGNSVWAFGGPPPPERVEELGVPLSAIPTSGGGLWEAVMFMGLHSPRDIAFTPDGQFAYVVDSDNESLTIVNTTTFEVAGYAPAGNQPTAIAITPPIEGEPEPGPTPGGGSSGGGGSSSGGSPTSPAPAPAPVPPVKPKPKVVKCRKGFKKHKVHGRAKCVRVKKGRHKHRDNSARRLALAMAHGGNQEQTCQASILKMPQRGHLLILENPGTWNQYIWAFFKYGAVPAKCKAWRRYSEVKIQIKKPGGWIDAFAPPEESWTNFLSPGIAHDKAGERGRGLTVNPPRQYKPPQLRHVFVCRNHGHWDHVRLVMRNRMRNQSTGKLVAEKYKYWHVPIEAPRHYRPCDAAEQAGAKGKPRRH